ncbi:hypothetical protein [Halobaculum litoreum]|uniref:CARDB protein n=1 Tax=Halobaculum litoreum TaxID=3031998 RepID=A0ABD5XQ45_9EURY|nr:hypothetical protein [Halobaculum sp. DT92]
MSRTTLALAVLVVAVLAGCTGAAGPGAPTDAPDRSTQSPSAATSGPDEPPLDVDGAAGTLGPDEPPHTVRIVNEGSATRNVTLVVRRDGESVYDGSFRSFPNTTVLGEIDHVGNYSLTVAVAGGGGVTETIAASSFDCNSATTTFDVSDPDPSVRTVSTEMACGTADG